MKRNEMKFRIILLGGVLCSDNNKTNSHNIKDESFQSNFKMLIFSPLYVIVYVVYFIY